MWDAVKGEEELTLQHKHIVKSVNFSPNSGNLLATASNDKLLRYVSTEAPLCEISSPANYTLKGIFIY